jgi:hypothetical protein
MTINQAQFAQVVEAAKAKATDSPAWLRSLEKAAAAILDGSMIVTTLAHGALVTTPGGTYHANGVCDCPARTNHCYHRAGARLWLRYEAAVLAPRLAADVATTAAITTTTSSARSGAIELKRPQDIVVDRSGLIASIKRAWPTACPGVHLADALMARFKCNTLEALSTDFIQAIHAIL